MIYPVEQELAEARRDFKLALLRFEEAMDKNLIDAAVYDIAAATNRIDAAVRRARLERMTRRVQSGEATSA